MLKHAVEVDAVERVRAQDTGVVKQDVQVYAREFTGQFCDATIISDINVCNYANAQVRQLWAGGSSNGDNIIAPGMILLA